MRNKSLVATLVIILSFGIYVFFTKGNTSEKKEIAAKVSENVSNDPLSLNKSKLISPESSSLAVKDYAKKIEEAKYLAPSIEDMSKKFETIEDEKFLKSEYGKSSELVKELQLLEKANKHALSDEELIIFTTELRRQGVIGLRLAELELRKHEGN
jgi:hypothetical protein